LFVVESSQILQRNVAFEIPALKKQIGKCQQIREECHTRHEELDKNIHEIQKQYSQLCIDMSIKVCLVFYFILFYFYFI
jgi:archaellum component FlaC